MKKQTGFTIIELMLTVAVLAVMLVIGIPGLQAFILNNRLTSQINTFNSALTLARSEAVKQNQLTVICTSSAGANPDPDAVPTCESDIDWSDGWIIFVDRNGDLSPDLGAPGTDGCAEDATDDCLVAIEAPMSGDNTLVGAASVPAVVAFNGMGIARCDADEDGATEACEAEDAFFTLCDFRGAEHARGLLISTTGRTAPIGTTPTGDLLECP